MRGTLVVKGLNMMEINEFIAFSFEDDGDPEN